MSLSAAARAAATLVAPALALGCAGALRTQEYPALREEPRALSRVAVAPFRAAPTLAADAQERQQAAQLVGRYVTEALGARGVGVVPPADLARALGVEALPATPLDPRVVASRARQEFGVEAVLLGAVLRFRKRSGEALGSTAPASVSFEVTLYAAPGGEPLWTALFDETQQPLFANVLNLGRYPGGGTRWLTAEELAQWGASEVAKGLPLASAGSRP